MRRMYSEQELTTIINEVLATKISAGAFDDKIADAVDDYLEDHPVDITALNGKTITPAVVNATTSISAPSIIETMSGYTFTSPSQTGYSANIHYAGVVKNGNKLSFVLFATIKRTEDTGIQNYIQLGTFGLPSSIANKLIPYSIGGGSGYLDNDILPLFSNEKTFITLPATCIKSSSNVQLFVYKSDTEMVKDTDYLVRYEATFLLSDSLAE